MAPFLKPRFLVAVCSLSMPYESWGQAGLVLMQFNAHLKQTSVGSESPLDESGYQRVAALKSNVEMSTFMRRFLETKNLTFKGARANREAEFETMVSEFSGVNQTRSFQEMSDAVMSSDWVWNATSTPKSAALTSVSTGVAAAGEQMPMPPPSHPDPMMPMPGMPPPMYGMPMPPPGFQNLADVSGYMRATPSTDAGTASTPSTATAAPAATPGSTVVVAPLSTPNYGLPTVSSSVVVGPSAGYTPPIAPILPPPPVMPPVVYPPPPAATAPGVLPAAYPSYSGYYSGYPQPVGTGAYPGYGYGYPASYPAGYANSFWR